MLFGGACLPGVRCVRLRFHNLFDREMKLLGLTQRFAVDCEVLSAHGGRLNQFGIFWFRIRLLFSLCVCVCVCVCQNKEVGKVQSPNPTETAHRSVRGVNGQWFNQLPTAHRGVFTGTARGTLRAFGGGSPVREESRNAGFETQRRCGGRYVC